MKEARMPPVATLYADGDYLKIAHLTDLHLALHYVGKRYHLRRLRRVLEHLAPDFVANTGDLFCKREIFSALPLIKLYQRYVGRRYPWTFTWGNHDLEMLKRGSRADRMFEKTEELIKSFPNTLYPSDHGFFAELVDRHAALVDPDDFLGGNFVIEVRRKEDGEAASELAPPRWQLFFFNSGKDRHIEPAVSRWARSQARKYEYRVPSIAFFHRPVRNLKQAVESGRFTGISREKISCGRDDGYVHELLREIGTVKACFFGHNHVNNFHCTIDGIEYHYGRKTLSLSYGASSVRDLPNKPDRTLPWGVTSIRLPLKEGRIWIETVLENLRHIDAYSIEDSSLVVRTLGPSR